jgi:hypothetical protein
MNRTMDNRRLLLAALCLAAGLPASAGAGDWPSVPLPEEAQSSTVAEQMTLNGASMRVRVFVSPRPPSDVAGWFRRTLGEPLVESKVQGKLVLGRKQGDYYQTVQLEAAGTGTRGTVAVTSLRSAQENGAQTRARLEHWLARLPAGTRVVTDMVSRDGDRQSLYMVFVNSQTEAVNRERVLSLMADEGYRLEGAAPSGGAGPEAARGSMFFTGEGREAVAAISRGRDGRSAIVLNTITRLQRFH